MYDIGRMVVKIAGRDAGLKGVVVDVLDNHYVLVDGQVRRRKVNVLHLDPLNQTIPLTRGASHEEVTEAFAKLGMDLVDTKPKQTAERQKKAKKKKALPEPKKKTPKKPVKKQEAVVQEKASTLETTVAEKPSKKPKTSTPKKKAKQEAQEKSALETA